MGLDTADGDCHNLEKDDLGRSITCVSVNGLDVVNFFSFELYSRDTRS